MTIETLSEETPDLTLQNVRRLVELFPECVTEGPDGSASDRGEPVIDFDLLRQALSDHLVEGPQERYRLDWPGKRAALLAANRPAAKTLRPMRQDSVDFDTTRNLFIEGDNLDALKLLQETYLGAVDIAYIDPPYNTGSDFIYDDNFQEKTDDYLEESGQAVAGAWMVANLETEGRFHSRWLSMMYARLRLARDMLAENGVLLVSINDREVASLRRLLDEIFGEKGFIAQFIWNNEGNIDQQSKIKGNHEYIVAFSRSKSGQLRPSVIDPNIEENSKLYNDQIENSITKNGPANPPSRIELPAGFPATFASGRIGRRTDHYPKFHQDAEVVNNKLVGPTIVESGWSSRNQLLLFIRNGLQPIQDGEGKETRFALTETGAIYSYKERSNSQGHVLSVIRNVGTTKQNSGMLKRWNVSFDYPKPVYLIEYLLTVFDRPDRSALIIDFFAGSGTTPHAVARLNARDGRRRTWIAVQAAAEEEGLGDIATLCRRRIKAATAELARTADIDVGFRAFRIDSGNFHDVTVSPAEASQGMLDGLVSHIKDDRSDEDLLFGALLRWGVDITLPLRHGELAGRAVWIVDPPGDEDGPGAALIACFARPRDGEGGIDVPLAEALAALKPLRVLFRDDGFASDAEKENVASRLRQRSPDTELKVL